MLRRALYTLTLLACGFALTACGAKGALYLPDQPDAAQRITP